MTAHYLYNRWILALCVSLLMGVGAGSWATVKAGWAPLAKPELIPLWLSSEANATAKVSKDVSFANGFAPVVQKILPAVVNITALKIVRSSPHSSMSSDPFFQQFFDDEQPKLFRAPRDRREHSVGSGVVVSPDGYIITNDHVVSGSVDIKVSLPDKTEMSARLVGTDPRTDIAILKVDAQGLPTVTLGDSSRVRTGDFSIAVGNSFGVGQAVTVGIISATGRGGFRGDGEEDFLQTDAAINPGNSGGALADINGDLIGINTAIISATSGSQGVGFAVPVNMARHVMNEILAKGEVTRGWLGVTAQTLDGAMARAFGLTGNPRGALINEVALDSPAEKAGLAKGDIILEINGESVVDSRELGLKISAETPGSVVTLKVLRKGKERDVSAQLKELPSRPVKPTPAPPADQTEGPPRIGLSVHPLTPQIAKQLGVSAIVNGIVIDAVEPGSPADEADLKRGDVIEEINQTAISRVDDFQSVIDRSKREPILMLIARGPNHMFIVVEPRT